MPVPTETFRSLKKLNLIFAAVAILLLLSTAWLIVEDHKAQWRDYQLDARVWETAMTQDAQRSAMGAQQRVELQQLEAQLADLRESLPYDELAQLQTLLKQAEENEAKLAPRLAVEQGKIGPMAQALEKAVVQHGADSPQVVAMRRQLAQLQSLVRNLGEEMAIYKRDIAQHSQQIRDTQAAITEIERQIDALRRQEVVLRERLDEVNPSGLAAVGEHIRNAPLSDWFNPSLKVQQVVVPDVRTDLNFLTVDTIDRCNSCHINIDNPAYEEPNLVAFVERQIAMEEGQDVTTIDGDPVVSVAFWVNAARRLGSPAADRLADLEQQSLERINALRQRDGRQPLGGVNELRAELEAIKTRTSGEQVSRSLWYQELQWFQSDVRSLLQRYMDRDQFRHLGNLYRQTMVARYNEHRTAQGLKPVNDSPVLLGHPNIEMYANVDSKHPMKIMGCTTCHEGAGQETQFEHTAHTPREIWVDAKTGTPVPDYLVEFVGSPQDIRRMLRQDRQPVAGSQQAEVAAANMLGNVANVVLAGATAAAPAEAHAAGRYIHDDLNLNNPDQASGAPFAPKRQLKGHALYRSPDDPESLRVAMRQEDRWKQEFGWHAVKFMYWEKPMHSLTYIESSCNKCHTEVYDLKDEAPMLYEGRRLFTSLGCASCHAVTDLEGEPDVRTAGPSLKHVDHKLSAEMIASWIWSPKSFRPTTQMPHFFMLENNSSPVDILRTRVEVAAMTHFLLNNPARSSEPYQPEAVPEQAGDAENGRVLFNQLGCLACHTNLDEHGEAWIIDDLVARMNQDVAQAQQTYAQMDYNQRHWYAMEHLEDRLENTGPELSGVGTKLKAGRDEAEAHQWLYNWLRNPQHYSADSIMPSFRLSPDEANDLSAYLLSLERPDDWQPVDFLAFSEEQQRMLTELVATIRAPMSSYNLALAEIQGWDQDDKLHFLGQRMIGHYGCNACHDITGFEDAASPAPTLDNWGTKDPSMIDYGFFYTAFDHIREKPKPVHRVAHEGLTADAPAIGHDSPRIAVQDLNWENIPNEPRAWLYNKVHNPRVYDRGRTSLDGELEDFDVGSPYDKLKMPKFFLKDRQAQSLVTYVMSLRRPLVSESLQNATYDDARRRWAHGRKIATVYNCYGCHSIEGEEPYIEWFFDYHGDGTFNPNGYKWAPPQLFGQGAKTQPGWLFNFLQDVHPIRPWLKVRMPSFPLHDNNGEHAAALVDYFSGHAQMLGRELAELLEPIQEFREQNQDVTWYAAQSLDPALKQLKSFGQRANLMSPDRLDPRHNDAIDLEENWEELYGHASFLQHVYHTTYPYVEQPWPNPTAENFARGERFITQLGCLAGNCHSLGDEDVLEQLAALDALAQSQQQQPADADDDPYGADPYGADPYAASDSGSAAASDPYGADDDYGYGDDSSDAQPAVSVAPWMPAAPAGDPAVDFGAPNLSRVGQRIQRRWLEKWIQRPEAIQPGTWMLSFFPNGGDQFHNLPPAMREEFHQLYGYTGEAQRQLLMDFMYAASRRNYTPEAHRLLGVERPQVELTPLQPPAPQPGEESPQDQQQADEQVAAPQEQAQAQPEPMPDLSEQTSSAIELHDEATSYDGSGTGRVVGVVKFDGPPARRRPLRMDADPFCSRAHSTAVLSPAVVVNEDQSVQWAFVYVKSGLAGTYEPQGTAIIDQRDCMYYPYVSGVMVNQQVDILNSDATLHNVNARPQVNRAFNDGMPVQGMRLTKRFNRPEMGIQLRCDVHPWMEAHVNVMEHPFFATSDVEGRFEITGLPPGRYTLEAWHHRLGTQTFEVEVTADTSHRADVTLSR